LNIHTQTLAAICVTCPHHIKSDELSDALPLARRMAVCEITNGGDKNARVPIPVRITVGNCPIGKFPRSVVQSREKGKSCGCKGGSEPTPQPTTAAIVRWPRSAQRATMYQFSKRTKRVTGSDGWKATGSLEWYGLPMPLRWWIMVRYGIVRSYAGCGCLVWLKNRAPWLDGPLTMLERFRLSVVAPVCVWWHSRKVTLDTPTGSVQVDNPSWRAVPGVPAKSGAWMLALLLVAFVALLGSVVA
jgi:hypothetical protein